MFKLSFGDYIGIAGIVLAIVLGVLDKSGKLKGPMLLILLGVAALMTLPLALGSGWVGDAPSGMLRFTRGMLLFFVIGVAYSVIAVWISGGAENLSVQNPVQPKGNEAGQRPPTLRDLFKSDFPNVVKFTDSSCEIMWRNRDKLTFQCQAYLDFEGKNEFVGFYIPSSPRTFDGCMRLADGVKEVIEKVPQRITASAGYGDQMTDLRNLAFSGRVFLYHEDFLSIPQKAAIIEAYRNKHYDVQFMGPDYLAGQVIAWHHQHDPKSKDR